MSNPPQDNDEDDDSALFHDFMKGVRPLQSDRRPPENTRHSTKPQQRPLPPVIGATSLRINPDVDVNHTLFYHRGGLQHNYIKRLKRGDIKYESRLDLHGQNLEQAQRSLIHFINASCEAEMRCVLVVHGRGLGSENQRPLLKQAVSQWLTQMEPVLAYASAIPAHGGVGAVYVILRRRR